MSQKEFHAVLQRVVDRSETQKETRVSEMRAQLYELGYSVVPTKCLVAVFTEMMVDVNPATKVED